MAVNKQERELRREAVRRLLLDKKATGLRDQKALIGILEAMGIKATQASVSRDLHELGAAWVDGHYELPDWDDGDGADALQKVVGQIVVAKPADQLILIVTRPGAGGVVAEAIEACLGDEIVGTVAGYSSVLILIEHKFFRDLVFSQLKDYFEPADEEEGNPPPPGNGEPTPRRDET
jgi:transcriptional regulator of arginine metabolism